MTLGISRSLFFNSNSYQQCYYGFENGRDYIVNCKVIIPNNLVIRNKND